MTVDEGSTKIYTINKSGSSYQTQEIYSSGFPTKWHEIFFGDFNGDGKTDLLTKASNTWRTAISTGVRFEEKVFNFTNAPSLTNPFHQLRIADFNGDGTTDILFAYTNTSNQREYFDQYYSRGESFTFKQNSYPSQYATGATFVTGDFNADGRSDVINRSSYSSPLELYAFGKDSKSHLLESVLDGLNHQTTFSYKTLSNGGSSFYTMGASNSSYPVNTFESPMYAVSTIREPNESGGERTTSYSYKGARLQRRGLGFLGFDEITETNYTLNDRKITRQSLYSYSNEYYRMVPSLTQRRLIFGGGTIAQTAMSYQVANRGNGRHWLRKIGLTENDYVLGANTGIPHIHTIHTVIYLIKRLMFKTDWK